MLQLPWHIQWAIVKSMIKTQNRILPGFEAVSRQQYSGCTVQPSALFMCFDVRDSHALVKVALRQHLNTVRNVCDLWHLASQDLGGLGIVSFYNPWRMGSMCYWLFQFGVAKGQRFTADLVCTMMYVY